MSTNYATKENQIMAKNTPKKSTSVKAAQQKPTPKKYWSGTTPDAGTMAHTIEPQQGFTVSGEPFYPGRRGL